jgi:hypothetical protein
LELLRADSAFTGLLIFCMRAEMACMGYSRIRMSMTVCKILQVLYGVGQERVNTVYAVERNNYF